MFGQQKYGRTKREERKNHCAIESVLAYENNFCGKNNILTVLWSPLVKFSSSGYQAMFKTFTGFNFARDWKIFSARNAQASDVIANFLSSDHRSGKARRSTTLMLWRQRLLSFQHCSLFFFLRTPPLNFYQDCKTFPSAKKSPFHDTDTLKLPFSR